MSAFEIKTSDTSPDIKYQLTQGNGDPISLSGANNVRFRMKPYKKPTPVVEGELNDGVVLVDSPKGIVKYEFDPSDTDTPGTFLAEWQIEYGTGDVETVPSSDYIKVRVIDAL